MKAEVKQGGIDLPIFLTTLVLVLIVAVPMLFFPTASGKVVVITYDWIADKLGLVYQWVAIGIVVFLGWLAYSPFGKIKLGGDQTKPEFTTFSWLSMLFCGGVGAGLIYWAAIEWSYYIENPPFGVQKGTDEGIKLALSYGLFHWGPMAWAIYALPTVAISYQYYVRGAPNLRLSTACYGFFKNKSTDDAFGRFVDGLFMISLLAGAGTSIGLAVPMISASFADAFGFTRTLMTDISVVIIACVMLAFAGYTGLSKGISKIAELNVIMAFAFLAFVLTVGPTLLMLRLGTESIGYMLSNMLRMVTYTNAIDGKKFVQDWTIFYWAWWIAYGPIVGIFVTRISRGRTLREMILSMSLFGSLGAWAFYIVLGNYAYYLDLMKIIDVQKILAESGSGQVISAVVGTLPWGRVMQVVFATIAVIFIAGTYNSKAYALAASTSKGLNIGDDPVRWNRVFWALALGILPIALMSIDGGIKIAMSAVLVASLPLMILSVLMGYYLWKCMMDSKTAATQTFDKESLVTS